MAGTLINLSDTNPAAPSGDTNVEWQASAPYTGPSGLPQRDVSANVPGLATDLAAKAPLASPALTGTPTAPTAAPGDDSTAIATTAFVEAQIAASAPGVAPVQSVAGKTGAVTLAESDIGSLVTDLAAKAPLASPALTGTPTVVGDYGSPALTVSTPTGTPSFGIDAAQMVLRGLDGGYGSGLRLVSAETGTHTVLSQATIEAEGATAWNSVATASSFLRFSTINAGTLAERVRIDQAGNVGIGTTSPHAPLAVAGLPVYANNAAAIAGGLAAGDFYRDGGDPDHVCVVH